MRFGQRGGKEGEGGGGGGGGGGEREGGGEGGADLPNANSKSRAKTTAPSGPRFSRKWGERRRARARNQSSGSFGKKRFALALAKQRRT
jgi:hypothetical protein